jgi:hypothetical protein
MGPGFEGVREPSAKSGAKGDRKAKFGTEGTVHDFDAGFAIGEWLTIWLNPTHVRA